MLLAISGCAVGPDFKTPPAPPVDRYTSETERAQAATVPDVTMGTDIAAQWWEVFHAPELESLLLEAVEGSPTLLSAEATLMQAQQAVQQARAAFFPQIDFGASVSRSQSSSRSSARTTNPAIANNNSGPINLYSLGPTISYVPDVFGRTRRAVEQQAALAERQQYQVAAAYLSLTGNAVAQAINLASARTQLAAVERILADDERNLSLVQQTFDAGKVARVDVLTAESQVASDRTLLPPLRQQVSVASHALAVLSGAFPGEWTPPAFDLDTFAMPRDVPGSLPSELVRRRPDILAAEAQLHADSAAIGVATADMYPSFTLSASVSAEAVSSGMFPGSSTVWNLAASMAAPVFHGGALYAQRQGAIAAFEASRATYQATVLQAFGQVADTLRALAHDAELIEAQRRVLDTSNAALELQRYSFTAGKANLLQLIDAERVAHESLLGYARARAQQYQDVAALVVAMGGGWWNMERLAAPERVR